MKPSEQSEQASEPQSMAGPVKTVRLGPALLCSTPHGAAPLPRATPPRRAPPAPQPPQPQQALSAEEEAWVALALEAVAQLVESRNGDADREAGAGA
ncbi:hypothetical protein Rsub_04555 [Raphidocelis subcapitata]|uniref:Uncharacterized protein n=1 Tax=Raphidocelis subcapitata TaxID=307507 RepID=A0A2V0NXU4_9CHLO|nr:hypothetical protein Rsub_04555 [Raphidocelis subcapitata]|eukprot:GBF92451.1 hypothetical protein Rsub_04555 [Raphidocelis subcapitata]